MQARGLWVVRKPQEKASEPVREPPEDAEQQELPEVVSFRPAGVNRKIGSKLSSAYFCWLSERALS